jgi:hypothetical protein
VAFLLFGIPFLKVFHAVAFTGCTELLEPLMSRFQSHSFVWNNTPEPHVAALEGYLLLSSLSRNALGHSSQCTYWIVRGIQELWATFLKFHPFQSASLITKDLHLSLLPYARDAGAGRQRMRDALISRFSAEVIRELDNCVAAADANDANALLDANHAIMLLDAWETYGLSNTRENLEDILDQI